MNSSTKNLFVYGTLRSFFRHPAHEDISNNFDFVGEAKIIGKLYDLGEYPCAVKTADDYFIIGELYQLRDKNIFDSAISKLDEYEGLTSENGEDNLYNREVTEVYCNNQCFEAWVYWYNRKPPIDALISANKNFDYVIYKCNH